MERRVYVYVDVTLEEIPRAFYVGKGLWSRVQFIERNELHLSRINKFKFKRVIVFETMSDSEACQREIELIELLHTFHYDYDFGCNKTRGGDGLLGRVVEDETCELLSQISVNNWKKKSFRQNQYIAAVKKWENEEYRQKRSVSLKTMWKDEKYHEMMRQNMIERRKDENFLEKLRRGKEKNNRLRAEKKKDRLLQDRECHKQKLIAKEVKKQQKEQERQQRIEEQKFQSRQRMIKMNKDKMFRKKQISGRQLQKVEQVCLKTGTIVAVHESVAAASKTLNVSVCLILTRIQNKQSRPYRTLKDFTFRYCDTK